MDGNDRTSANNTTDAAPVVPDDPAAPGADAPAHRRDSGDSEPADPDPHTTEPRPSRREGEWHPV